MQISDESMSETGSPKKKRRKEECIDLIETLRGVVKIVALSVYPDKHKPVERMASMVPMLKDHYVDKLEFIIMVIYTLHYLDQLDPMWSEWIASAALNDDPADPDNCGFDHENATVGDFFPGIGRKYIEQQHAHTRRGHFAGIPASDRLHEECIVASQRALEIPRLSQDTQEALRRDRDRFQQEKATSKQKTMTVEDIQKHELNTHRRTFSEEEKAAKWIHCYLRRPIICKERSDRKPYARERRNYTSWVQVYNDYHRTSKELDHDLVMALTLVHFDILGDQDYIYSVSDMAPKIDTDKTAS